MNLVEDICTYHFQTNVLPQQFKRHRYIFYLIVRPGQATIAEIFCSGLLQCWADLGGFSAYLAGRSVASSKRVRSGEWEKYLDLAMEMSPLEGNMKVLKERAENWRQALEWEDETEDEKTDKEPETAFDDMDVT